MSQEHVCAKKVNFNKAFRTTGEILYYIFIAFMAMLVFFLIKGKVTKSTTSIGKYQMYIVLSGSMSPEFNTGSIVVEKPINPEKIKVNDIITYKALNGSSITHRVVGINKDEGLTFITKGDANNVSDPSPIDSKAVVGKVIFAIPYVGYIMGFARTKAGTVVFIIVPGSLIIINEFMNLFKAIKEEKIKKHNDEMNNDIEKNN